MLNKLAGRAQAGEPVAVQKLFEACQRITWTIIFKLDYNIPNGERDDLCQEAMMSVMRALKDYDPAKGTFSVLAELAIKRSLWTSIKTANRTRQRPLNEARSLDGSPFAGAVDDSSESKASLADMLPSQAASVEDRIIARDYVLRELGPRFSTLTELEYQSLFMLVKGYTYNEIANELGVGIKAVDNAYQRAKSKLAA